MSFPFLLLKDVDLLCLLTRMPSSGMLFRFKILVINWTKMDEYVLAALLELLTPSLQGRCSKN